MRIDRLDLRAFGPFTDHMIDLSEGDAGLHIVFGPNEAGKSSALRAITQMFYGIPTRSTDDFVHQKTQMRIGATIRNGQSSLSFVRKKGTKSTLRDGQDEESIDEAELQVFLDGLDEVTFRTVFGFQHEQLVQGGREILEGQGNIGQALFAASAGLSGLRGVMTSLQEEAGELFKPSASKPRINAAIADFKKKKRELKELQLRPEEWARVDRALNDAQGEREDTEGAIKDLSARRNRLNRALKAVPLVGRRDAILLELAPVTDAILLPEDFHERRLALMQEQRDASREKGRAQEHLEGIESEIESLFINEDLLAQKALVEDLYQRLGANRKALDDSRRKLQPKRHLLEEQAHKALITLRPEWKLEQIETLRMSSPQRNHILELGQQRDTLDSERKHAQTQLTKLEVDKDQTAARLAQMESVSDPAELERSIRRIQKRGDQEEQLNAEQQEHDITEGELASALSRLGLWEGTPEDLEELAVPSQDTINQFSERLDQQRNGLEESNARRADLEETQRSTQTKIETLRREQDVPTEETLDAARSARTNSWRLVRGSWQAKTLPGDVDSGATRKLLAGLEVPEETTENLADAYEFVTDKADDLSDRLRREASRVEKLAQLETTALDNAQRLEDVLSKHKDMEKEHAAAKEAWSTLWHPLGIVPRSPREMTTWAQHQHALVIHIGVLRSQVVKLGALRQSVKESKDELNSALHTMGEPESQDVETLAALLDRANDIVAARRKIIQTREHLETHLESLNTKELPAAHVTSEEASQAFEEWQSAWNNAMEELGEAADTPPKRAIAVTQQIDELLSTFDEAQREKRRIDEIAQDDQEYRRRIEELTQSIASGLTGLPADQAILSLHKDVQQSSNDSVRMEDLKKQREEEEVRCREADIDLTRITEDLLSLCREAQVECLDALSDAEERSQLRQKQESALSGVDDRLIELSSGAGLDDFLEMARKEDPDTLGPEIAQLDQEIEEKEGALKQISEEIGERRKELRLMDGSAEAAQVADEAQALLASMATDVEHYTRLRISELVLARAIEQYRERNQGPLLRRAGELFSKLTLGSFSDLRPNFGDNDEDILVGLRANTNTSVPVSGMSDGTADQLYLALRLASLELYLDKHPPIPLVLDDILINFDDERAVATLRIMADLSQRTQIIFFTHHQHLVDLAKENLEQVVLFTHTLA